MLCPNCENDNRDGAKFCDECGFPLTGVMAHAAPEAESDKDAPYGSADGSAVSEPVASNQDDTPEDASDLSPEDAIMADGEAEIALEDAQEAAAGESAGAGIQDDVLDDAPAEYGDYPYEGEEPGGDTQMLARNGADESEDANPGGFPATDAERTGTDSGEETAGHIDFAGFDTTAEYYGERIADASELAESSDASFRDGGTMQMPKIDGKSEQKAKDYRSSSTVKKKFKWKPVVIALAIVAIAAAAIAFGTYCAQMWGGKAVPDVVGMTEADARSVLADAGFEARSAQVKSDDTEGLVLIMDPSAGTRLDEDSEVVIHIAATRTVPEIVGKAKDDAQAALAEAGYENVTFKEENSDKKKGTVTAVKPKEGERAKSSAEITVTVAKPYSVPDVSGKSVDEAAAAIEKAGLGYEVVYYETSDYPEGTVVNTDPAAGTEVKKGDYVVVNVAQARGANLEELAASVIGPGSTIDKDGSSYTIESLDSVAYLGNDTVSYTATAHEYVTVFGSTVSNPNEEVISGTIVFDENDEVVAIS